MDLYQRLSVLGDHVAGVGKGLNSAVSAYNKAVGSLEQRVLVTARRFTTLGVVGSGEDELARLPTVDTTTRVLQAAELVPLPGSSEIEDPTLANGDFSTRFEPLP